MYVIFEKIDLQVAVFNFHFAVNYYHDHGCFTAVSVFIWKRKRGYASHTWVFVIWYQRVDGNRLLGCHLVHGYLGEGLLKFTSNAASRCMAQMLGIMVFIVLVGLHEALGWTKTKKQQKKKKAFVVLYIYRHVAPSAGSRKTGESSREVLSSTALKKLGLHRGSDSCLLMLGILWYINSFSVPAFRGQPEEIVGCCL